MRQSIVHVALVVPDYDEAIQFFTQKLDFTLVDDTYQPQQDKRWVLVAPAGSNGPSLLLARATTPEQERAIGNQTGGRVFLFLSTDDFWRDYHRMVARGISFVREPKVESYGTVAVFKDIYGNLWDLLQWSSTNPISTSSLWPAELDALVAAPSCHRLMLENERVRVLDTIIGSGERTPVHTHQWRAVHYVLSWSDFVRRDETGTVLLDTRTTVFAKTPPQVLWGEPLGAHSLENVGPNALHIISVEQKPWSRT